MSQHIRHNPPRPAQEQAMCMCAVGWACTSFAPGHAVHLIQARLVSATPSEWADAIVVAADPHERTLTVREVAGDREHTLWSGRGAAGAVTIGEPVAFHTRYHALAVGSARFNVLRFG